MLASSQGPVGRQAIRSVGGTCCSGLIAVAALCLILLAPGARAGTIPGGGLRRSDCLAVFETPLVGNLRARRIVCTDGDPTCDADGIVNGACSLEVGVCLNASGLEHCSSPGVVWVTVEHAEDDGDRLFDPDFQALQARIDAKADFPEQEADVCTALSLFRVPVDGPRRAGSCRSGQKTIRLDSRSVFSDGRWVRDRDRLRLVCRPAPGGCDAALFFAGTFDRIQQQVFDQRCATGGCHDSESTAGGLLEVWILAGAPAEGWVPGTD
jgi:hypothetical protein